MPQRRVYRIGHDPNQHDRDEQRKDLERHHEPRKWRDPRVWGEKHVQREREPRRIS